MSSSYRAKRRSQSLVACAISAALVLPAGCGSGGGEAAVQQKAAQRLAFSPNGSQVAVASRVLLSDDNGETTDFEHKGYLDIVSTPTGDGLRHIENGTGTWGVAWSPDGKYVAAADEDKQVRVYDAISTNLIRNLRDTGEGYWSVAFSPDSRLLAAGGRDWKIRLWDVKTGSLLRTLIGHEEAIRAIAFSPDGATLASVGWRDEKAILWNTQTGAIRRTIAPALGFTYDLAWSPDGAKIAIAAGRAVLVVDSSTGEELLRTDTDYGASSVAWSPDAGSLAVAMIKPAISLRNAETGALIRSTNVPSYVNDLEWSPDGTVVLAADVGGHVSAWSSADGRLQWSR